MTAINKVFGVGMSKTGTTTLGACFEQLGFNPHSGFEPQLKRVVQSGKGIEKALKFAQGYRSFEDSPWYLLYKELDERFPGSKFVLTVRRNSMVHAKSSWSHGVRAGVRTGEATDEYINEKVRVYETHNQEVMDYFKDRPDDLLVMCWEDGDGWEKLCPFLGAPMQAGPIPHCNAGRYQAVLPAFISESVPYLTLVRLSHWFIATPLVRWTKRLFVNPPRQQRAADRSSSS